MILTVVITIIARKNDHESKDRKDREDIAAEGTRGEECVK